MAKKRTTRTARTKSMRRTGATKRKPVRRAPRKT